MQLGGAINVALGALVSIKTSIFNGNRAAESVGYFHASVVTVNFAPSLFFPSSFVAKGELFRVSGAALAMKMSTILVPSEATNGGVIDSTNGKITLSRTYISKERPFILGGNATAVGPQSTFVLIHDDGSPTTKGSNVQCNNVTYSPGVAMVEETGTNFCGPLLSCVHQVYDNSNCDTAAALVNDP
jgi:hypothetical protein